MRAFAGLLRKEMRHILRDRRTLTVLIALPVLQVVLFGYAIRTDVTDVRLAIVDPAPDYATLALRSRFTGTGVFRTVAVVSRLDEIEGLFQSGAVQQAIVKAQQKYSGDESLKGAVMASDGFFPFRDAIDAATAAGITAIVQPGGSVNDYEAIEACNESRCAMVFSLERCFSHH